MPTRAEGLGLTVNSPCAADWDSMAGSEQVRFCEHCEKSVHNVSAMTRNEALRFVRANSGGLCVRFYSDPRGRTIHAPAGKLHAITRRASRAAAGAFGAAVALGATALAQTPAARGGQEAVALRPYARGVPASGGASLTGTVLDPNGSLVAGASVTATNKKTGEMTVTETNAEGVYRFESLAPGAYSVEFEADGFGPAEADRVELQEGVEQRQDSVLAAEREEAEKTEEAEQSEGGEGEEQSEDAATAAARAAEDASKKSASGQEELEQQRVVTLTAGGAMIISPENPLVKAVSERDAAAAKGLIALGADVNVRDERTHTTPLIEAASNADAEMVSALIAAGADVNTKSGYGDTALTSIGEGASAELVRALVAAGAKVNHKNDYGETALMAAASNNSPEALKALIEAGAKVDAKNKNGSTALLQAAQYGLVVNVRLLLAAGADVNAKDSDGDTALKLVNALLSSVSGESQSSEETPAPKGAREPAESEESRQLKRLSALLVSYGAVE